MKLRSLGSPCELCPRQATLLLLVMFGLSTMQAAGVLLGF